MKEKEENQSEDLVRNFRNGKIDRRTFLIIASAFAGGYGLSRIIPEMLQHFPDTNPLSKNQEETLKAVQRHLFPATETAPGADEINALAYLQLVLLDPALDPRDQEFLVNGIGWLEEECQKVFSAAFTGLEYQQKEQILREIEKSNWGERWLSNLLKYIFEALLTDPLYGGNPDNIGWKWLSHTPGIPRPSKANRYRGMQ